MTVYHLSLAIGIGSFLMCFRVLMANRRRIQNWLFFAVGTAVLAFTGPIYVGYLFPEQPELTTSLNRVAVGLTAVTTALLWCFSLVFPAVRLRRLWVVFSVILLPSVALAIWAIPADAFVRLMEIRALPGGGLVMDREVGPLYASLYAPLIVLNMLGAIVGFSWQWRRATTSIERLQVAYTGIAMGGGGSAATLSCIILPLAGYPQYYILGPAIGIPVFIGMMVYNIRTFKAMDIDELLSRSVLWLLSLSVAGVPFGLFTWILLRWPSAFNALSGTAFMMLGLGLVVAYHRYVQPRVDQRLLKKSHDYRRLVEDFNRRLSKLTDLNQLLDSLQRLLSDTLYPASLSFVVPGEGRGQFALVSGGGESPAMAGFRISEDQAHFIVENAEVLEREQLEVNPDYSERVRESGRRYLASVSAEVSVPLVMEDRLIGAINLGPRRDGHYKRADINFLEAIRAGVNVALSNSMLLRRIERINSAYERFVPRQMLSYLGVESITDVGLGDCTEIEMTVLFSDIRSFTTLSEQMSPQDNFRFLNSYLRSMGPMVRSHGGFIDKYIGDAVMALFPGGAADALRAAAAMCRSLQQFNASRSLPNRPPIDIGIGIHTGRLMLGTIGEDLRMEVTVISDAVNQAARLEGLCKTYGERIIVSARTLDLARAQGLDAPNRSLGQVQVKGKSEPVEVFALDVDCSAADPIDAGEPALA